jgi:hypothetical protein
VRALPRLRARLWRAGQFAEASLALAQVGPPWHRGIPAVVSLVAAVLIGLAAGFQDAVVIAPALAFFLTLADTEGPLVHRFAMLSWSACWIALAGVASILLQDILWLFALAFALLTLLAGLAAWAGPPFLQASRFGLIVGLLLTNVRGVGVGQFLILWTAAVSLVALLRALENLLAPDRNTGDFATLRQAWFKLRAARPLLWRFASSYVAVASLAWTLGRLIDQIHPTWLTVSTLVVMWPDVARSYQRIVQRVFGTLTGGLTSLVLISLLPNPLVLSAVALAMAFFLPHFVRRNYWLHSALVVVFVMVALDVSAHSEFTPRVVAERIGDVLLGCAFAMLGTVLAFGRSWRRARRALSTGDPNR